MDSRVSKRRRTGVCLLLLILIMCISACTKSEELTVEFSNPDGSKSGSFKVEVVKTPESRAHGLMYRREMASDHGMLFVFPEEDILSFWMKNTYLPLDMIFINAEKKVVSISESTKPFTQSSHKSNGLAKYVLEVLAGRSKEEGIVVGSQIEVSPAMPIASR